MLDNGIPCIKHHFFISPANLKYLGREGNWQKMLKLLKKYKKVVCKPNEGSGGENVIIATNEQELEQAVSTVFATSRGLALCPFYEIEHEYRAIVLDGMVKLIFLKQTPFVIGNGKDNVLTLIAKSPNVLNVGEFDKTLDYQYIPFKNEIFRLNWKHNLGLGAAAKKVTDRRLISELSDLALHTTEVLNTKFVSVDIVKVKNKYMIIEVNGGVSMGYFSSFSDKNQQLAKAIYKEALLLMFEK